jgi:hypothetical protein
MRWVGVWLMLGASLAGRVAVARAEPPADVLAYTLFAIKHASIGAKSRVQGDAGCLFTELALGPGVHVNGAAAAPAITVGRGARVSGGLYCGTLDGGSDACMALPNPLVTAPSIVLAGPASNVDISAAKRTKPTSPLAAGTYGALVAGTASEIALAGGSYQFESITLGSRAKLLCRLPCDVTVRRRVEMGQATRLGAGDGVAPSGVVLRIAAQGETTALATKSRAQVRGTIYAPGGDVVLGAATKVTGALVGNTVTVGSRARLLTAAGAT